MTHKEAVTICYHGLCKKMGKTSRRIPLGHWLSFSYGFDFATPISMSTMATTFFNFVMCFAQRERQLFIFLGTF